MAVRLVVKLYSVPFPFTGITLLIICMIIINLLSYLSPRIVGAGNRNDTSHRRYWLDLEIDRVDRFSAGRVDRQSRLKSSRLSEREVESVDNIDSKSTFGSGICHETRNQQTMNVPILCFTGKNSKLSSLASLARTYLTASASSVACESTFSISGMILNGRRSLLSLLTFNRLIFIHDNAQLPL